MKLLTSSYFHPYTLTRLWNCPQAYTKQNFLQSCSSVMLFFRVLNVLHHRLSMLVMISNVLWQYFANSTNTTVHLSVLCYSAGRWTETEGWDQPCFHLKWRSYGLVKRQKNQRVRRRAEKTGTVPRTVPGWWAQCSNVSILDFNWLRLWFQISPWMIRAVIPHS